MGRRLLGNGACSVTMSSSKTVSATFNLVPIYNLTLSTTGNGGGTITPKPVGTSCGTNCYSYSSGTVVQVTASASAGSTFAGWGGACSGTGACSVTMSSTRNVSATFTRYPVSCSLTLSTTGGGKITPNPLGTSCGTNCYSYTSATVVQVTETPNSRLHLCRVGRRLLGNGQLFGDDECRPLRQRNLHPDACSTRQLLTFDHDERGRPGPDAKSYGNQLWNELLHLSGRHGGASDALRQRRFHLRCVERGLLRSGHVG